MSVGRRGSELGELLADDPHLFAVVFVGGEAAHFVPHRRAEPSACGGLAQGCAHGFRVGEAAGADDV
jgi:hypothetical protein